MEDLKKIVSIDLHDFGAEGTILVARPTLRRTYEHRNEVGRCYKLTKSQTNADDDVDIEVAKGDLDILNKLIYIRRAPFRLTVDGYLDFMDILDTKEFGSAERLDEAIDDAISELFQDVASPFVGSPPEETAISD